MKVAVIEDSEFAREGLEEMLQAYSDLDVICSAGHPDTALELLSKNPADVLFLDIHMPGSSGFELLSNLDYSPFIIFTTAYSEYAIKSFDFKTVDYLLKPISRERLDQAIEKLRYQFNRTKDQQVAEQSVEQGTDQILEMNSRLFIKDRDHCFLVELADVRYFESCKNEARAFFGEEKAFVRRPLGQLEERLPKKFFFRASRQFIVNLRAVKTIEESIGKGFSLVMDDGKEIEITRRRAGQLTALLSF